MDKHELAEHGIHQRDSESVKAFRAFRTYLQAPRERRSLRSVEEEGFARGSLSRWSVDHEWQARAKAFDASLAQASLESLLDGRIALVTASITDSLGDAQTLREALLKHVPGASVERLASIITSRVELDNWQGQVIGLLNRLGEHNAQA